MIRKIYINNLVLKLYSQLPRIKYPLDLNEVLSLIPNCKLMSYQKFADINHCSVNDVIALCQSKSGCTHYDVETNRYLILVNLAETSNYGRRRWTIAHEIGHIVCGHHILSFFCFAVCRKEKPSVKWYTSFNMEEILPFTSVKGNDHCMLP